VKKIKPNCNYAWNVPSSSYPSVRCCLASIPSSLLLYQNCNLEGTGSSLNFHCLLSARLNTFVQKDIRKKVMCVHKNEQVNGSICYSRIPLFYKAVVSFWPFIASLLSRLVSLTPVLSNPKVKGKGKAIPLQAWTGPEGSRRLRFPDFKTVDTWRW